MRTITTGYQVRTNAGTVIATRDTLRAAKRAARRLNSSSLSLTTPLRIMALSEREVCTYPSTTTTKKG